MSVPRVCFDNNAWSAVLNREEDKDLESIERWFKLALNRRCRIIVPTLVVLEASTMPDREAVQKFQAIIRGREFDLIDLTSSIAMEAGKLRRQLIDANKRDGTTKTLKTPDAIIVASADAAQCQYLLTDDIGIQRLNGKHGLTVIIGPYKTGLPDPDQPLLDQLEQ